MDTFDSTIRMTKLLSSLSFRLSLGLALVPVSPAIGIDEECGIYLAKSTIPGAGLGMFAGHNFTKGSNLTDFGDPAIPLVDQSIHQADDKYMFLWDEYTWDGGGLLMDHEAFSKKTSVASMGFGAAVNCILDLVNVKEGVPQNSNEGLHRAKDAGVGAFSTYWNRQSIAKKNIHEGEELFASYGESYFTSRDMGPVPLKGTMQESYQLMRGMKTLRNKHNKTISHIVNDMWETFVWKNPFNDTSRILFSIPKNWEDTQEAFRLGELRKLKRKHHSRDLEWLKKNGVCGDHLTVKRSTLPQAGRGAFAKRKFAKDSVLSPLPLIHLTDRRVLEMYHITKNEESGKYEADTTNRTGHQLLLNYCIGHNQSSILLCPYGIFSAYVNHNQSLANVKIQWADPSKSNHKPDWLNLTIAQLEKHESAGLAMELVATRDIEPDEEIFLDYGDEWEAAWQTHLSEWPYWYDKDYVSSFQLNEEEIIKTEFEQIAAPYPQNVELRINLGFDRPRSDWLPYWRDGTLPKYIMKEDDYTQKAEVITREHDLDGNIWYDVLLQQEETKKLRKLPRQAITFFDRPHTSDIHLLNAFRHDIRAPNELFPEIWKNVIPIDYEPTEKSCNAEEICKAP